MGMAANRPGWKKGPPIQPPLHPGEWDGRPAAEQRVLWCPACKTESRFARNVLTARCAQCGADLNVRPLQGER